MAVQSQGGTGARTLPISCFMRCDPLSPDRLTLLSPASPPHPLAVTRALNLIHPAMPRREWCQCCGKYVTLATLKKHAEEAKRRQHIATLGGDVLNPPVATLKVTPITGNDIFGSHTHIPPPTVMQPPVDEDASNPDLLATASPPPAASLPHFLPSHPIEDNDFQPDPIEDMHDPPQVSDPPDCYPSMGTDDTDDDEDEDGDGAEDKREAPDGSPDLEDYMDWEYLRQGNSHLRMLCWVRGQ